MNGKKAKVIRKEVERRTTGLPKDLTKKLTKLAKRAWKRRHSVPR